MVEAAAFDSKPISAAHFESLGCSVYRLMAVVIHGRHAQLFVILS